MSARPSWPGRGGRPPGRVLVRLTFSFGRFVFLLCSAPSGLGWPFFWFLGCQPPPLFFFFLVFPSPCAPLFSFFLWFPAPGTLGLGALFFSPPPRLGFFFLFSSSFCAPVVSGFLWFPTPGALGLGAVCCLFGWPLAPRLSVRSRLLCGSRLAVGCSLVVAAPPPPPFVSRGFRCFRFASRPLLFVLCGLRPRCLWLSLVFGPRCPGPWRCVLFVLLASRVSALSALAPLLRFPLGRWLLPGGCCRPPLFVSRGFRRFRFASRPFFFLFPLRSAPLLSVAFASFRPRVPWALVLCAVCFVGLPRLGSPCARASFVLPARPLAAPLWFLPRPPSRVVFRGFRRCRSFLRCICFRCAPPLSLAFFGFRPWVPWASALCAVCFAGLPLVGSPCALAPLCFPPGRWPLPGGCCPRPPLFVSRGFRCCCSVLCFFFCSSAFLAACPPPPPGCVRGALCCLVLPRCGAFPCCVPCCGASPCCVVGCCALCGVCWGVCLCVVLRCWLLLCVVPCLWSCRPVWLFAVWLSAWFWSALPYAVLCCVPLGAVLRCPAGCGASRCCAAVCCVVLLRLFGVAACCAVCPGAARRPWGLCFAVLCFAVFPRAVCSVLCVFCRGVLVRAVVRRCAVCCVCPEVSCVAFPVLSALCGAVVRSAGALASCCSCGACCCGRLMLGCAAVCCAVSFGVLWCGSGSGGPWLSAGGVFWCWCPCLAAWSASLWLMWFTVVPCFPVSCSLVLCCRVVLCCCALLLFCGAVCACFALLWPVVLCCAVLLVGCAVSCPVVASACCGARSLPAGTHKKRKSLFTALCYPAPVSVSVVDVVGEVGLVVRRVIADPGRVVFEKVVLFVVVLACLQQDGGRTRRGWGRDGKGRYMKKKIKREGASLEAWRRRKIFFGFTRCSRSIFLYVYGVLERKEHGVLLVSSLRCLRR